MTSVLLVTGLVAGGVGRHVLQLAQQLTARGDTVTVACPPVVAAAFDFAGAGVRTVRVDIAARPAPHRDRSTVATLRAQLRGVDVVHAHGLRAGALSALARNATTGGPALVVTLHNSAPVSRVLALLHRGLERVVATGADLLLGVSDDLVARAVDLGAPHVGRAVVPAERVTPGRSREEVRAELEVPAGQCLVVTVGRLAAQKGLDRLLEALVQEDLGGRLLIVGDGPQRPALSRKVQRHHLPVTLLGHRDDVADLLGAADVALSAARWEGQPVWLQEALSVGLPVVATDVGGTREVLDGAGVLVPGQDMGALVAAVRGLLADPAARQEQARRSRVRAAELPTTQDALDAAVAAYQRACALRAGRHVD